MSLRLTASDFYTYFRPYPCRNRIYLKQIGKEEAPPSPYEDVLIRLGDRHETSHLASFPECMDLREGDLEERALKTKAAVEKGVSVIYQAVLRSSHEFGGMRYEILGEPDFLIRQQGGYVIRDSKISRRITEKDHPEILRQLEIYGWLYEKIFDNPPTALQVHSGTGEVVDLSYDGGAEALQLFKEIASLKTAESEIYSPVGWSKCGRCSFHGHCWQRAIANRDVALVPGIDQNLATTFKERGITTIEELVRAFDEDSLSELKRPWGTGMRRVGKDAAKILRTAKAISDVKEILIQSPAIPDHPNYAILDLEGLPPQLDELEKIYLWGVTLPRQEPAASSMLQASLAACSRAATSPDRSLEFCAAEIKVFGKERSDFMSAVAGFGEDGDREGWKNFLTNALASFDRYGDIPFVHWHHYERVKIDLYLRRYGDLDGIAERVKRNLLDLLQITQRSVALPLPSYSLKVVEKYVGFKRTLDDVAGDWAMAKYIEATEAGDGKQRENLMDQILAYNREDLEATWAVLKWLKSKVH